MRTPFISRPAHSHAAGRLSALLPALSAAQARNWTGQVSAAGTEARGAAGQREAHIRTLSDLLGWNDGAAENLYNLWKPLTPGDIVRQPLTNLGPGTPAFMLSQESIFPIENPYLISSETDDVFVYEGFPGTLEQQNSASAKFLDHLPKRIREKEGPELVAALNLEFQRQPEVARDDVADALVQRRRMTFFACRRTPGREFARGSNPAKEIVAFASVSCALTASRDGSHSLQIDIERLVQPVANPEVLFALSDAISLALWRPASRYLWCAVGNSDKDVYVKIVRRARHAREEESAAIVSELLEGLCGWPNTDDRPGDYGIGFEITTQA